MLSLIYLYEPRFRWPQRKYSIAEIDVPGRNDYATCACGASLVNTAHRNSSASSIRNLNSLRAVWIHFLPANVRDGAQQGGFLLFVKLQKLFHGSLLLRLMAKRTLHLGQPIP